MKKEKVPSNKQGNNYPLQTTFHKHHNKCNPETTCNIRVNGKIHLLIVKKLPVNSVKWTEKSINEGSNTNLKQKGCTQGITIITAR